MLILLSGFVLLILKVLQVDPVAQYSWLTVCIPFALAVVWMEFLEPWLGLDVMRQRREQKRFMARFQLKGQHLSWVGGRVNRVNRKIKKKE